MIEDRAEAIAAWRGTAAPAYATSGAAGMDVVAAEELTLAPGQRHAVATGFAIAIPPGYEVQVRPRSGLALKHGITCLNTPGTIDEDYRGEVKVILANLGDEPFEVGRGERIAQLVPAPVPRRGFGEVEELTKPTAARAVSARPASEPLRRRTRPLRAAHRAAAGRRRRAEQAQGGADRGDRRGRDRQRGHSGAGGGGGRAADDHRRRHGRARQSAPPADVHAKPTSGEPKAELAAAFVAQLNRFVDALPLARAHRPGQCRRASWPATTWSSTAATISRPGWRSAMPASRLAFRCVARPRCSFRARSGCSAVAALLSLLRRRCVRYRGLRQLRRARRARRADGTVGTSPRCWRSNASLGSGPTQAGQLHLFDGEKLAWRRSAFPPTRAAGPAVQPRAAAIRATSWRATSSLRASGQSSTPSAVTRWTRLRSPPITSPLTSLATIQSQPLDVRLATLGRPHRRSRRQSRSAGAGAAVLARKLGKDVADWRRIEAAAGRRPS